MGTKIKVYESIQKAATEMGVKPYSISKAANGINKTSKGFVWKFEKRLFIPHRVVV